MHENVATMFVRMIRSRTHSTSSLSGRLDTQSLGLSVPYYDQLEHYNIVKNKWFGLKPPPPPAPDE